MCPPPTYIHTFKFPLLLNNGNSKETENLANPGSHSIMTMVGQNVPAVLEEVYILSSSHSDILVVFYLSGWFGIPNYYSHEVEEESSMCWILQHMMAKFRNMFETHSAYLLRKWKNGSCHVWTLLLREYFGLPLVASKVPSQKSLR